jgi:lipopolysaccharide/colanic/teichoic acid biosynthesis glycosyltransferase
MYRLFGKRLLEIILCLITLVVTWPLLVLVTVFVRSKLGAPIFFRQMRAGLHGKPFMIYKYRTMRDLRDANGALLPDAERLTPFGDVLRRSSLDEMPELINVLKGEMSLVGPRPLLVHYLERYTREQMRRHEVRPGITGWAQVNGRNALSWEEKFALDVWYVDHVSLWLDIRIIALTLWKVLRREGISQVGHVTAEEFRGSSAPS